MVFLSRWLPWSSSLSFAPMVFLSLTGSNGLPLTLAVMVFLSNGLHFTVALMVFLSNDLPLQWSSFHGGSNGLPLTLALMDFFSRWLQ